MNKKGMWEGILSIKVFIFLVIFILLYGGVLFAFSKFNPGQSEIVANKSASFNDIVLLNYLRSEVEVDGVNMSVSDLILKSYYEDDFTSFEDVGRVKADEVFNSVGLRSYGLNDKYCCLDWNLLIKLMPSDKQLSKFINRDVIFKSPETIIYVEIPLYDSTVEYIKVVFFEEAP